MGNRRGIFPRSPGCGSHRSRGSPCSRWFRIPREQAWQDGRVAGRPAASATGHRRNRIGHALCRRTAPFIDGQSVSREYASLQGPKRPSGAYLHTHRTRGAARRPHSFVRRGGHQSTPGQRARGGRRTRHGGGGRSTRRSDRCSSRHPGRSARFIARAGARPWAALRSRTDETVPQAASGPSQPSSALPAEPPPGIQGRAQRWRSSRPTSRTSSRVPSFSWTRPSESSSRERSRSTGQRMLTMSSGPGASSPTSAR